MSARRMPEKLDAVNWKHHDFLDLGASRGNSVRYGMKRFGGRSGLGIDLSPKRVAEARASDATVVNGDATRLDVSKQVRFVVMMDFISHLPNVKAIERTVAGAAESATDFMFIYHLSFEDEEYLNALGLRLYWWRTRAHRSHFRISDYCAMFDRLGLRQYMIRYVKPIEHSSHPSILGKDEPVDEQEYDPLRHRPKPDIALEKPVWRAQEIFVALRAFESEEWTEITRPYKQTPIYPDTAARGRVAAAR